MSAANWIACHAVRHMHEFGTTREQLAAGRARRPRSHAALNPAAVYRDPLTLDDYLNARMVSWPFGLYDCDAPCDGSTAVIVSRADAARDLPAPAGPHRRRRHRDALAPELGPVGGPDDDGVARRRARSSGRGPI